MSVTNVCRRRRRAVAPFLRSTGGMTPHRSSQVQLVAAYAVFAAILLALVIAAALLDPATANLP